MRSAFTVVAISVVVTLLYSQHFHHPLFFKFCNRHTARAVPVRFGALGSSAMVASHLIVVFAMVIAACHASSPPHVAIATFQKQVRKTFQSRTSKIIII